ncbi:MAG: extracellular solute-binding protein [Gemmatimonadota bacterium]
MALAALAACGGGDDGRTQLMLYSPHGRELLEVFEARYEELNPHVDVVWLDMGSQEVLERVRSERANPQADVWWGAPAPLFETAAREGLLAETEPSWAGALPASARDPEGMWYGTFITPEVIAYNTELVSAEEVPKDWDEVLEPQWTGRVLIRDPLASGTMRAIFGMIVDRSIRETGDTAAGMDWLRRLDAQTKEYVLNPTLLYQKLARQEGAITLWDMPDLEELKARTTFPIDYVFPTSGTPTPVDAVAVVAGGPNPGEAAAFVEWIGSDEAIIRAARDFFRLPARADIPGDSLPDGLRRAQEEIISDPMDWERFQAQSNSWMMHWDEHVRGRGGR